MNADVPVPLTIPARPVVVLCYFRCDSSAGHSCHESCSASMSPTN